VRGICQKRDCPDSPVSRLSELAKTDSRSGPAPLHDTSADPPLSSVRVYDARPIRPRCMVLEPPALPPMSDRRSPRDLGELANRCLLWFYTGPCPNADQKQSRKENYTSFVEISFFPGGMLTPSFCPPKRCTPHAPE